MLSAPSLSDIQTLTQRSYDWVKKSRRAAPNNASHDCVSMYRALPITFKVAPGYTVPGATSNCDYVRHMGNEKSGVPQVDITLLFRRWNETMVEISVGNWPDGQPALHFQILRTYNSNGRTNLDIYYFGKPSGDTRAYPIQMYWGPYLILGDHRNTPASWIYNTSWAAQVGGKGNKFFLRTEDQVAMKLLQAEPDSYKLTNWCNAQWGDTEADIHAPLFKKALNKPSNQIYDPGTPVYKDCDVSHSGCPNGWPMDNSRYAPTAGWGFSHRSKVCIWQGGYTWILAQDPLGLLAQAIHTLIKVNDPWHTFYDEWPTGIPGKPTNMTPIGIAEWVRDNYYRPGVGATMWSVPIIGGDDRISSLRTNQFAILTALLGYRYLIPGWAAYADELANILTQVSVGGPTQPSYGCKTAELGNIRRPDYYGAQLYVWDYLDGSGQTSQGVSAAGSGITGLGLKDFGWLRSTINHYFNLPSDDEDFILSTIETTATYCQALRVYGWHKYGWLFGPSSTIPGY